MAGPDEVVRPAGDQAIYETDSPVYLGGQVGMNASDRFKMKFELSVRNRRYVCNTPVSGEAAATIRSLPSGAKVKVVGRMETSSWYDRETGVRQRGTEIHVTRVIPE